MLPNDLPKDLAGTRVLVVEDTVIVAVELVRLLELLGCEVEGPFHSIREAETWIRTSRPVDIAILDVNLSGDPIYPVADEMIKRGVPFAFITGYMRDYLHPRYTSYPVLEKPFSRKELSSLVHSLADETHTHPSP
jgi:DNA-binding NtrC family response regulator